MVAEGVAWNIRGMLRRAQLKTNVLVIQNNETNIPHGHIEVMSFQGKSKILFCLKNL